MFGLVRKPVSLSLADVRERPMWIHFFQSMALLSVALASALYSSTAAAEGQIGPAAIAASGALAIAIWVGIRFVPRMARGVDWRWMPIFSQYKTTTDGMLFIGGVVIVLAAAVNTANNLLYMVLSVLLAVLALSAILSAMNFRFLEMQLLLPERTFAGETFAARIRIRNKKRVFPAFSLHVEPPGSSLYFTRIRPQATVSDTCEMRFDRRGHYTFRKLRAASRFPFGLFSKTLEFKVNADCICYPQILPQEKLDITVRDIQGASPRYERGLGYDLHTIRDYLPSDSARHVHWKASAKTATLKTREFSAEDTKRIVLVFDRKGDPARSAQFEENVSYAASLAFHLTRNGAEVRLVSDEWESPSGMPEATLHSMLHYLALVELSPDAPPPHLTRYSGALLISLQQPREFFR
jgi:uncharacterized protein (DUF58 family)